MSRYDWGMRVRATIDMFNDGSHPGHEAEALLVKAGDMGEIVQIGQHVETDTPVYIVEFSERLVIGCFEEEIEPV